MINIQRSHAMSFLQKTLLLVLFCSSTFVAFAQNCTITTAQEEENAWNILPSIYDFGGSTFTACKTGLITSISFKVTDSSTIQPNALLFLENGVGDGILEAQSQTMVDYVQEINIPGDGATVRIELKTPFPVTKGEVYTWYVQKDPEAGRLIQSAVIEPNNTYTEGQIWYNNEVYPAMDNIFSVAITSDK